MTRKTAPIATALALALGGCQSTAGGSSSGADGGQVAGPSTTCYEEVPDPSGNPSGITVDKKGHRIVGEIDLTCVGGSPATFYFQMYFVHDGAEGAGIETRRVPGIIPIPLRISTARTPGSSSGIWHIKYLVSGQWPDGEKLFSTEPNKPDKAIGVDDC